MSRDAAAPSGPIAWPTYLQGGGEAGELMRSIDWSKTPVGAVDDWPWSLKSTIGLILNSQQPMFLFWGPDLTQFYNDGYVPSFGKGKHPSAMGKPAHVTWQEIWPIISPQIESVMADGRSIGFEDALVPVRRNARIEEVYWTYTYSPVFGENGRVAGALVIGTETTQRVTTQRRLETLRLLDEHAATAGTTADLRGAVRSALVGARIDFPFAVLYGTDGGPANATEATIAVGMELDDALCKLHPQVGTALKAIETPVQVAIEPISVPDAPWPEPVSETFVVPLKKDASGVPGGFIVFGLSPRLPLDETYSAFLKQIAEHIDLAHARFAASRSRAAAINERNNMLMKAPMATAVMSGPDYLFELANRPFMEMVDRPGLIGRTLGQAFPELVNTPLIKIFENVYETGEPFAAQEMNVPLARYGRGVEDAFFRFSLEPLRDATGRVYGIIAVALEVTEQVVSRRVLEKAYDERAKLLDELESASRAKDEFLAMLGHELRNPLSPIVTALQLMKMRGDRKTAKEQHVIERQVQHLTRLVDDLLDVSKITRGKIDLRKERGEIYDVVGKAVEIASVLFEERKHQLEIDVPRTGLPWEGDPVRLAQALTNLLTNAARYTDVGGKICLRAWRDGDEIVISVRDNGIGIPENMLPRVFELFVQGKRSADRAEGGLGLGLALTKNLVALHGGSVHAASAGVGKGSEFVIRLPLAQGTPVAALLPRSAASDGDGRASKRVLIVDDNGDAADLLAEVLRDAGHEVAIANDPWSALKIVPNFRPEVAVLDIGLPVMDGYELAARLRTSAGGNDCRLVALTGYGRAHDRQRSDEAGFSEHLVKPVDLHKLLSFVAEIA
jgi:signal transduction histidine kinase/CheY-like chemotaxis protein